MDPNNVYVYQVSSGFQMLTNEIILANFAAIATLYLLNKILNYANYLIGPINYERDMTTKDYCQNLAELDNSSDFMRTKHNQFSHLGLVEQPASVITTNDERATQFDQQPTIEVVDGWCSDSNNNNIGKSARGFSSPSPPSSVASPTPSSSASAYSTGSDENSKYSIANENKLVNGWIPVLESIKLGAGQVKKTKVFGKDLIVTRSSDGRQVNVLDAYCPHAGVHIGVGGRIKRVNNENCVECPFHGWAFRTADGQCVDIPYQRSSRRRCIPKQAKLASWICAEVDNFIYVWHHMDGEAPTWHLEPSKEITSGQYELNCRTYHKSNLDLCYMHENGADMFHFSEIHQDFFGFGGQIQCLNAIQHLQKYVKHTWQPEWKPMTDEMGKQTHKAQLKVIQKLELFGNVSLFPASVVATQIGPAVVKLRYETVFGNGLLIMNSIPMGGRRVKYIQHLYTNDSIRDRLMGKMFMLGETLMLERDLMIWNHKKSMKNYILVPEDRNMKLFKMWYSQFYKRKRKIVIQDAATLDSQLKYDKYNLNGLNCDKPVEF